ncbi:hypothetical protein [Nocardia altamirensis]|uniref:hypothetical protein n=1 Tax=Nocardia altamirensis TaxID=472158 RepID=UPI0009FFC921|nr:hypothetical protein [Nocardia altamirensis]
MTENNGDRQRARRRAVRSVGPPVEETANREVMSVPAETARAATATALGGGAVVGSSAEKASAAEVSTESSKAAVSAGASVDLGKSAAADSPVDLGKTAAVDEPADADQPKKSLGAGRLVAMAAAAVLVLALVVGAAIAVVQVRSADARAERRTEYVQTARQAVLNLTTIRADSAKQDIDRILAVASGQFKSEFDGRVDPFMNIVQQAKVVSTGEIVEAAVESDDENSAKVLVAAKQTLTNAGQEGPQTRLYRFRVTVDRGDAGLTVSNVEFVA